MGGVSLQKTRKRIGKQVVGAIKGERGIQYLLVQIIFFPDKRAGPV